MARESKRPQAARDAYKKRLFQNLTRGFKQSGEARKAHTHEIVPATARHRFKERGTPFRHVRITRVFPSSPGIPARVAYKHLTRATGRIVPMNRKNLDIMGGNKLSFAQVSELLGEL